MGSTTYHMCITVLLLCCSISVMSNHTDKECTLYCKFKEYFHKVAPNHPNKNICLDTVRVVFYRLGVSERIKRSHGSYHTNGSHDVVKELANTCPSQNTTTKYDFIVEERTFFKFCRFLLSAAVTYPHHSHNKTTFNMMEFDNASLSKMYSRVSALVTKQPEQSNGVFSSTVGYEVEAYANRFLCTDEEDIRRSPEVESLNAEDKRDFWAAAIVFKLLKGYNFLKRGELCPGTFLQDIFDRYGPKCITDKSLERLFSDLIHGQPSAGRYQNTDFSNHYPNDDRRQVNFEQSDKSQSRDDYSNNHERNVGNPPPCHNGPRPVTHDRQCHGENFQHNSKFLHQPSHSPAVLQHHSWRQDKPPLEIRDIIKIYYGRGGIRSSSFGYSAFLDICPAILHQALRSTMSLPTSTPCTLDPTKVNGTSGNITTSESITRSQSYLYGSLSVLIISLCSLLGAGFMKLSRADVKIYIMGTFLSLAVGCLVADAALHLLPEVILDEDDETADDDVLFPGHVKKLCAFLGSIYIFFVLELFLSKRQSHSHKDGGHGNHEIIDLEVQVVADQRERIEIKSTNLNNQIGKTNSIEVQDANNFQAAKTINTETNRNVTVVRNNSNSSQKSNEDRTSVVSDRLSTHDPRSGIKALAWMIILGDGIHNFADGLAIGAAFSLTFTKGLSISITVLCHEIPHELGDFAVLIATGMSIKKAVVLNFLSSLTAFAGLYVGLVLGSQEEASKWIFSVGAGMFLYVALTDLVPECKEYFRKKPTLTMFIGQLVGIIAGYVVMLLLALYENKLEIKL